MTVPSIAASQWWFSAIAICGPANGLRFGFLALGLGISWDGTEGEGGTHLPSPGLGPQILPICVFDSGHADGDVPRDSVPETWMYMRKRGTEVRMGVDGTQECSNASNNVTSDECTLMLALRMAPSQRSNVVLAFSTNRFTLKSGLSSSRTSSHGNIIIRVVVGCVLIVFSALMLRTTRMRYSTAVDGKPDLEDREQFLNSWKIPLNTPQEPVKVKRGSI
ncbi:hypothetical protein B0H13DRAFT_1876983 [Mycena leptocephala]|nr:hypothetical protein B0H13DRAFT_1876983 [Mycena leptocephala]